MAGEDDLEVEDAADVDTADEPEVDAEDGAAGEGDEPESGETADAPDGEDAEDAGGDGGEEAAPPVKAPTRRERELIRLRERTQAAEERARTLEAERVAERNRGQNQEAQERQRQAELAAEEEARLNGPESYSKYITERAEQRANARIAQMEFRIQDSADRTAFEGLCSRDKACAAVRDDVEAELARIRASGMPGPGREALANYLIGKRARERAATATTKQRKRGEESIRRQTTRPSSGRGDVAAPGRQRGDTREARRKRLENQPV